MSTSLWPTEGSGTSCSQIPGSARALTSAFIKMPLVNDGHIASRPAERLNDLIELFPGVCSTHLGANSRFSMGNDRKCEGDDIDALRLYAFRQLNGQRRIAEHDGNDGMFARNQLKSQTPHLFAEIAGVRVQTFAQLPGTLQQLENVQGGRGHRRRNTVRKQIGQRTLAQT